jgi:nucleoside-diphosphate-sugar epimerase
MPGERHPVVGSDRLRQAAFLEQLLEGRDGQLFAGRLQRLAQQEVSRGVVGDGQRIAVLCVAEPELAFKIGAPQVHQMTALASMRSLKHFDDEFAVTNRLRTEGTRHLLEAAHACGARKFVAQSYTGWPNERRGGRVKTEEDPLDSDPPKAMTKTLSAIRALEDMVLNAPGITGTVLRYGSLYGPGTSLSDDSEIVKLIRQRKFPLIGSGAGVWSFIHVDDAARATQLAIERAAPGIYNIVDDDPAEVSVWLPELARAVGAKPPFAVASLDWSIPGRRGRHIDDD